MFIVADLVSLSIYKLLLDVDESVIKRFIHAQIQKLLSEESNFDNIFLVDEGESIQIPL